MAMDGATDQNIDQLFVAARAGDLGKVRKLVKSGKCDINCTDSSGWTPLHHACNRGSFYFVEKLIAEFKTDINCADSNGQTPLHHACREGHYDKVRLLIVAFKANINCADSSGWTPLHHACCKGNLGVPRLVAAFDADVNCADSNGWTPLHHACREGHFGLARMLIEEFKADVNCADSSGWTPLHHACREGHLGVARVLIAEFKVDVNCADSNGWTSLHHACSKGHLGVAEMLIAEFKVDVNCDDSNGRTPLYHARSKDMVKMLIAKFKADVNCADSNGWTPLHHACREGHLGVARMLIAEFKTNVNCADSNGWTPLHHACREGHLGVARMLIAEFKADVNCADSSGWTPVKYACREGKFDVVKMLIEEFFKMHLCVARVLIAGLMAELKASVNCANFNGWTPLHHACREGHLDMVKMLIAEFKTNVNCADSNGWTPLHHACSKGHLGVAEMLIAEFKVDVNCDDSNGRTPLYHARSKDMVKMLIAKFKADVNCADSNGWTPLHHACREGHLGVARMLIAEFKTNVNCADSNGWTPLHHACSKQHLDMVKMLIAKFKADVNCADSNGWTPLHHACREGHLGVARMLIAEFKTNVNCADSNGWTPLHHACREGHLGVARMLIAEFKADVNCADSNGWTPLHHACREGHLGVARMLIAEFKADVNCADSSGWTPVKYACREGKFDVVKMLIEEFFKMHLCVARVLIAGLMAELKASVNCANFNGWTPLHHACREGHLDMVKMLIAEFKTNVNCADSNGWTPLHHACSKRHLDIVKMLIAEFKADVNCADSNGWTPLHHACREEHLGVARMLIAEFKANVNCADSNGWTPVQYACREEKFDVIKMLIEEFSKMILLHHACREGHLGVARVLIAEFKANFNCSDSNGWTPLHHACREGHLDMVKMLIAEFKADVNCSDSNGWTPLHHACREGHLDMVKMLIAEFKADVNCSDSNGWTPLHHACREGHLDMVKMLIAEFKADVNCSDSNGWTPLHHACSKGHLGLVRMLIVEFKAVVDKNTTPLHVAALHGNKEVVLGLIRGLDCGTKASPLVVDDDGNTPLHLASSNDHSGCVQALLQHNAPILMRNKSGKTSRDVANGEAKVLLDEYFRGNKYKLYLHYDALQKRAKKSYSGAEYITRLFVIGNPGAGKSSLVETLKKEGFFQSFLRVTKDSVPLHTAGIIPSVYKSRHYGRVLFYDFAGDPEYYSSHAAILENIASSSKGDNIFIIVINLSEDHVRIKDILGYWFSFVQNQKFNDRNPSLIAIGSHYDLLDRETIRASEKMFQQFEESSGLSFSFFLLDCCKPQSRKIGRLTNEITSLTKDSPRYELSLQASILLGLLEKDFRNVTACSMEDVISHIQLTHVSLPDDSTSLLPVMEELHDIGLLFVVGDSSHGNFQVVLNISQLTQDVHKLLFSNKSSELKPFLNAGILPPSLLEKIFPDYITKECLIHLQYCQEISHKDVGAFSSPLPPISANQTLLFFPALCNLKRSEVSWFTPPDLGYSIGWLARCIAPLDYFPSRFLHVLLLRLVFKFTLPIPTQSQASADHHSFQRRCTMWKAGVHWLMEEGVECMVELVNCDGNSNGVVVITRSDREMAENCIKVFNSIINCVMQAKAEFCHSIKPEFFLVDSAKASSYLEEDRLFAMSDVEGVLNSLEGKAQVVSITGTRAMKREEIVCLRKCTHWDNLFPVDFSTDHLRDVDRDLYSLGLHLQLPANHLRAIELDFPTDTDRRRRELVWRWLSSSQDPPCWWRLVQALKKIDHNVSALEIETAYGKS